jgi:hypothetical protein
MKNKKRAGAKTAKVTQSTRKDPLLGVLCESLALFEVGC